MTHEIEQAVDLPATNSILDNVALIANIFGDGEALRDVILDWFCFIGGRPGQVIIVDNGSPEATQSAAYSAYREGLIDKLVLVRPGHCDTGNHQVYIGEHTAPAISTKPYLLWFHLDTLPFRSGYENWLSEAIEYLDREEVFAVSGAFNSHEKIRDAWPGWYYSQGCSENFALMKRSAFVKAMEEFCGEYISSGFAAQNPASENNRERYLLEVAFAQYLRKHGEFTLVREENANWTIFHTNRHGDRLVEIRKKYLDRKDISRFLNAASKGGESSVFYGDTRFRIWLRKTRADFGRSRLGPVWRAIKRSLTS